MDPRVIAAALTSFENDDFLTAKDLVKSQVKVAKNDFLKAKLGLKNDIEDQFTPFVPGMNAEGNVKEDEPVEEEPELEPEPVKKKRVIIKKK